MNEADTSNNRAVMESLNSANSLQPESASCPFYSVVPSENLAIRQLPLLKPAEEKQPDPPNPQSSENVTQEEWVAEPDSSQQAAIDDEFQKLLVLNEELRAANNELYEQVEHLKDDLAESEKALQWQKRRSSVTESMLNQQAQELIAAQEQIQSLFQQLDTTAQTVQRQETLIETYKAQLQISQQRLAQLERECALLQTNYNDQSQQVLQSETTCRELRTRLMRQQRQTLQFKAALEKCLEPPAANNDSPDETASNTSYNSTTKQSRFSRKARSLFPNVQPIRPWSAEPESAVENADHPWAESSAPPSPSHNNPVPQPSSPWNWQTQEETSEATEPDATSDTDDEPITSETVSADSSAKLDEQIDSLIQMFFASQPVASPSAPSETDVITNTSDVPIWETWVKNDEQSEPTLEEQLEALAAENDTAITVPSSVIEESTENNSPISFTLPLTKKPTEEPENYWSETTPQNTEELSETELLQETLGDYSDDSQSPSPVVYPQRPPKGRKSLASVELPNFQPRNKNNS